VLELQRSLDHFEHQFHFISLAKVLVAPLPAETGLAGHLAANLAIGVETPDLGSVLDLEAVPSVRQPAMQAQYLRLLGVALRDEEARA